MTRGIWVFTLLYLVSILRGRLCLTHVGVMLFWRARSNRKLLENEVGILGASVFLLAVFFLGGHFDDEKIQEKSRGILAELCNL